MPAEGNYFILQGIRTVYDINMVWDRAEAELKRHI